VRSDGWSMLFPSMKSRFPHSLFENQLHAPDSRRPVGHRAMSATFIAMGAFQLVSSTRHRCERVDRVLDKRAGRERDDA
jgi:preprotein translocase subunit SecA